MKSILQYEFDEESEVLNQYASSLISKYEIVEFAATADSRGYCHAKEFIHGFGGARLASASVKQGFIVGGAESEMILKSTKEKVKSVSLTCNNHVGINLYVNSDDKIRGFVFFDYKAIREFKKRSKMSVDERTGEVVFD